MKLIPLSVTMLLASGLLLADDGALQIRDVSKTPDWDTEHASLQQLWFNVPVQRTGDETIEYIEYLAKDETVLETRTHVRPLIAFYEDGPVEIPEDSGGFYGHGERDMYAALSLDDGDTWKKTNLSRSADKSSISITVPKNKKKTTKVPYPGDVFRNFTTVSGNKVLAVWASRYCNSGNANYAMEQLAIDDIFAAGNDGIVDLSHIGEAGDCDDMRLDDPTVDTEYLETLVNCPYFADAWGVAGSQGIQDFADEGYPTVGQVPYACMWTARGTLETVDADGKYDADGEYYGIIWRQAERLTSGRRDVHRMEAACLKGAGCVVTWQEDPDGLRPGKGEGPGEGWSGAIAHHQTDIWYSYIDWDNFDLVWNGDNQPVITTLDNASYIEDGIPKIGVPMSIPVRLTDNAMCTDPDALEGNPYCYMDFDGSGEMDFCADDVEYVTDTPEGPDQTLIMCVAEDGRLMRGNTASTRTRTNLRGYDSDADPTAGTDSGWVILAYEESKGLGEEDDDDPDKIDMGKNIWYHTFDMFNPELVSQGMILNQPAIYVDELLDDSDFIGYSLEEPEGIEASDYTGYDDLTGKDVSFRTIVPDPIYSVAGLESTLYQMEIARRYSQITQPASKAGDSGTVALAMYKQGIVRQGGPADVFARRFVIPDVFDAGVDNPFDYANMVCDSRLFEDGLNPRYVKGLCLSSPQNLSATTLVDCEDGLDACEAVDFPYDDLVADIDKSDFDGNLPKMTEWRQCQEVGGTFSVVTTGTVTSFTCDDDDTDDQSWENPYELSKGHRGFMYGDFIMQMYAWSPNWEANTMGHDNYNLYVRRSFNGGQSWTTLPDTNISLPEGAVIPDSVVADGNVTCEWYGVPGGDTEFPACFTYDAGDFEQARNLSQLIGTHDTVLDPRFAGTDPSFLGDIVLSVDFVDEDGVMIPQDTPMYPDDIVDPSKFFATFEEGDTEEIAEGGEGTPMDMFYGRAINFGDEYELAVEEGEEIVLATDCATDAEDCEFSIFDTLEWKDPHAAEASLKASPGGMLFYAIWNEWMEDSDGHAYESDAQVRRTIEFYDDGVTFPSTSGDGGGGDDGGTKPGNGNGRNK
jgi:hypothetical protein